jgi:hypothetical protein
VLKSRRLNMLKSALMCYMITRELCSVYTIGPDQQICGYELTQTA